MVRREKGSFFCNIDGADTRTGGGSGKRSGPRAEGLTALSPPFGGAGPVFPLRPPLYVPTGASFPRAAETPVHSKEHLGAH